MLRKLCLTLGLLLCVSSGWAALSPNHSRRHLPAFFYHSYIGISAGYANFHYTNAELAPDFTASKIATQRAAGRIFIGHYFTPYLALQLSLMRPFRWVEYSQLQGSMVSSVTHSVWTSVFGLPTIKPTWRINNRWWLYGETGLGVITRKGFVRDAFPGDHLTLLQNAEFINPLFGAGVSYHISHHFYLDLSALYTPPRHLQPPILYAALGFYYYIFPSSPSAKTTTQHKAYYFPLNVISAAYFHHNFFNWEANKYVTEPYLPIFWDGDIKTWKAFTLMYERNFFHTDRTFSFDWGVSASYLVSRRYRQPYGTFSAFPAIRLWIVRGRRFDLYFTYSVAGPTFITRRRIDDFESGERFTFQDFLGFGVFLGQNKHLNMSVRIMHYSNGNLFSENPGIAVPVMFSLGYAF